MAERRSAPPRSGLRYARNASLEKGLQLLAAFDGTRRGLRLKEIVERTGIEKSAAQRLTYTLLDLGYLRRDEATKAYSLSPRVLEFASAFLHSDPLVERAYPYLIEASRRTGEAANLVVRDDTTVIYLARVVGDRPADAEIVVGAWYPAWAIADGHAILSHLPEAEALAVIARSDLRRFTERTTATVEGLMAAFAEARERGYAYAAEQYVRGTMSVAAPVLDFANRPVGAISIHAPIERADEATSREVLAPVALECARAVSRALATSEGLPPLRRPARPAPYRSG